MREHDSPVGVSLFTRALESGDKRPASQKKLLRRVIIEKLSRQQIEQILRDSFGTRRQGGPKHKIETASQFLAELERTSITVNRLCDQAVEDGADYFDQLPETLQHQIKSLAHLTKAMISAIEAERKDRKKNSTNDFVLRELNLRAEWADQPACSWAPPGERWAGRAPGSEFVSETQIED